MRAVVTILWDSLQLLRARRLFWVVLWISVFVGLIYASVGFTEEGFFVLFGAKHFTNSLIADSEISRLFYLLLFTNFISPHWLGFLAIVLALVTSCSVFPELMREGAVETVLSKPVPRWQVFVVKYLGVLGFMAIPLTLFCGIVFLAMGWRVGVWKPEVFWAVPLLTFVFSILYSVAVLVGIWTRSTLFALLSALLVWGLCYLVHVSESLMYMVGIQAAEAGIQTDILGGAPPVQGEEALEPDEGFAGFYQGFRRATRVMPKPRKATLMLKRLIPFEDELGELAGLNIPSILAGQAPNTLESRALASAEKRMSMGEILWPSAGFQLLVLGGACVMFCRRDF